MTRKYTLFTSRHRPDHLQTIWVVAAPEFSTKEAKAKTAEIVNKLSEKCGKVFVGHNDRFAEAELDGKKARVTITPREIEVIVPRKCAKSVQEYLRENWKGKWTKQKAW